MSAHVRVVHGICITERNLNPSDFYCFAPAGIPANANAPTTHRDEQRRSILSRKFCFARGPEKLAENDPDNLTSDFLLSTPASFLPTKTIVMVFECRAAHRCIWKEM